MLATIALLRHNKARISTFTKITSGKLAPLKHKPPCLAVWARGKTVSSGYSLEDIF